MTVLILIGCSSEMIVINENVDGDYMMFDTIATVFPSKITEVIKGDKELYG